MLAIIGSLFGAVTVEGWTTSVPAYWDVGSCGPRGNDHQWGWCGEKDGDCPLYVRTNQCKSYYAFRSVYSKPYSIDGCRYNYYARYDCAGCTSTSMWRDQDGDDCAKYDRNGWCKQSWTPRYHDSAGRTADQACCECGGGNRHCVLPNGQHEPNNYLGSVWHGGDCISCLCSTSGVAYCGYSDKSKCRRRMGEEDTDGDAGDVEVEEFEYDDNELAGMDEEQLSAFLNGLLDIPHKHLDLNAMKPKNGTASGTRRMAGQAFGKPKI